MSQLMLDSALVKRVISATQDGLPICDRPYQQVAERMGISEQALIALMQEMLSAGLIRRIGLVPNHYALGYRFNLMTVWDVDDQAIPALGAKVGQLDFVSHCYQRPRQEPAWRYNLFAMLHGRDEREVEQQVAQIKQLLGSSCRAMTQLKSLKILKKTGLRIRL